MGHNKVTSLFVYYMTNDWFTSPLAALQVHGW